MITLAAFLKGRDKRFLADFTSVVRHNAEVTVNIVNELLQRAGRSDIDSVNSGWRPRAVNDATANSGANSMHITGEAVDLNDPDRTLATWCIDNIDVLVSLGLWMEHPAWCLKVDDKGVVWKWVHLQTRPPKSGRRIYRPNTDAPYDTAFFEEHGELGARI